MKSADRVTSDEGRRLQSMLAWAERIAQTGSWEFVPSEESLLWSANLYVIFGVRPGEVDPSIAYFVERAHPDDRARVDDALRSVIERGKPGSVDHRITRGGDRRHLRTAVAPDEQGSGPPYRVVGVVQDLTDRRRAEREIAALVAVAEALRTWEDLEQGAHTLMARLADALDCVAGVFWVPRADVLVPRVFWQESGVELHADAVVRARPLSRGSGLPGRTWEAREPMSWTQGATERPGEPRDGSRLEGLTAAVAIPALAGGEVLAVVELRADRQVTVDERLQRSLFGIAHELGLFLERRGGELADPLLTPREREMLQLAAQGFSARETAERLTVSAATVRTHLENIYRKLEVSDKPSAVATALRLGVID